jgi:hypothetical protein
VTRTTNKEIAMKKTTVRSEPRIKSGTRVVIINPAYIVERGMVGTLERFDRGCWIVCFDDGTALGIGDLSDVERVKSE